MKNVKQLMMAITALLALGALVGAAPASATDRDLTIDGITDKFVVTSDEGDPYPAYIDAEDAELRFGLEGWEHAIVCADPGLIGYRGAPSANMPMAAQPGDCTLPGIGPVTFEMNECHFAFSSQAEPETSDPLLGGWLELKCDPNNEIELEVSASGGPSLCTVGVPAQQLTGMLYLGYPDHVWFAGDSSEVEFNVEHTSIFGFLCGAEGSESDNYFSVDATLEAVDD